MHICELLHAQLVADEATSQLRFRDYVEDERRMARLFEAFVRNFYTRELPGWSVGSDTIHWELTAITRSAAPYLPARLPSRELALPAVLWTGGVTHAVSTVASIEGARAALGQVAAWYPRVRAFPNDLVLAVTAAEIMHLALVCCA